MCYDRDDIDWLHLYENVLNNPCFSLELNHHHPAHLWGYFHHHHHHHHRHPRHHHHHYYYFMYLLHRTPDNAAQCAGLILVIASFFLFKMVTTRLVL